MGRDSVGLLRGLRTCGDEWWGTTARSKEAERGCVRGGMRECECEGGLCMRCSWTTCMEGRRIRIGA